MKYKSYENSASEEFATALNAELLHNNDIVSARAINRPIINILENQESNYNLIQTLLKTVYGNTNGIVPDVLEEFAPESFAVGSFKNDTDNYFVRVPTGMAFIHKAIEGDLENNNSNPFLVRGDFKYLDTVNKEHFLKDKLNSFSIENKPELNLYERQLANFINLDLTDLTNDIKIYQELTPSVIKVALLDDKGYPKYDAQGNPAYVLDNNSDLIYLAEEGKGDLTIKVGNKAATIINEEMTVTNGVDERVIITKQKTQYYENLEVVSSPQGLYTSDINKALKIKDFNGNVKQKTGYYINVTRATSGNDEVVWLPNKKANANWEVFLQAQNSLESGEFVSLDVSIVDENNSPIEILPSITWEGPINAVSINDKLFSAVNTYSDTLAAEKIQKNDANNNPIIGTKILTKSSNSECNNYQLSIQIYSSSNNGYLVDEITKAPWNKVKANNASKQKYFYDIFELTNAFLGCFSSYLINVETIYNYVNLETILKISDWTENSKDYFICYDLNGNLENSEKINYDKTGRFFITNKDSDDNTDNFIKLYNVRINKNSQSPYNYYIEKVEPLLDVLDRRLISTKRAELNTLLSTTKTELKNYIHIKDSDKNDNRSIEIMEKDSDANAEQMRITSPVLRLVDVKNDEIITTPSTDNWEDTTGDGASNFFEKSHEVLDTTKSEDSEGFRTYVNHLDESNKGIVIDKNKGIKIFNNDKGKLASGNYAYSPYKPIEILSKYGNINILNTENENGRINIRNLKDKENNIIDLLGITRVRSKQADQLVVRKIGEINNLNNSASILFSIGESLSINDTDAVSTNLPAGRLSFYSGKTGEETSNIVENNRMFKISLGAIDGDSLGDLNNLLVARNTIINNNEKRKVIAFHSSLVPVDQNFILGFPKASRSYSDTSYYIPYSQEKIESVSKSVTSTGTSTEYIGGEGRWAAAFINKGYFGKLILADTEEDIINGDIRNGVLRLGNSNIYDVSRLFINKTAGVINFDTQDTSKENTIFSYYKEGQKTKDGFFFALNRSLSIEPSMNTEEEDSDNFCALAVKPEKTEIAKNLHVKRQLFVNEHTNSSTEDNSSLVVKGQSVVQGELLLGKDFETVNNESYEEITRDTSDKYKYYNEEYFNSYDRAKDEDGNYVYEDKEDCLYLLYNKGRSYFDKDITLSPKAKFTEDTTFNKTIKILNKNYANYDYNEVTPYCPSDKENYITAEKIVTDSYDSTSLLIPRNNTVFDIASGRIIFGSLGEDPDVDDRSDLLLYGSQWTKRRLEVGTETPQLLNTFMSFERLEYGEDEKIQSPSFYVEGASQFNGDVVFGHKLQDGKVEADENGRIIEKSIKKIANTKLETNNDNYAPSRVIFWGANKPGTDDKWNSDFDFHGRTWFDNTVRIGIRADDLERINSNETGTDEKGYLEILGKNNDVSLKVEGGLTVTEGHISSVEADKIVFSASSNTSSLALTDEKAELYNSTNENKITLDKTGTTINTNGKLSLVNINSEVVLDDKGTVSVLGDGSNKRGLTITSEKVELKFNNNNRIKLDTDGASSGEEATNCGLELYGKGILIDADNGACLALKLDENNKILIDSNGVGITGITGVTGDTTITGNLKITGNNAGNLVVDGATTITGELTTSNDLVIGGAATITGKLTASNDLEVTGDTTITGKLTAKGGIKVSSGKNIIIGNITADSNSGVFAEGNITSNNIITAGKSFKVDNSVLNGSSLTNSGALTIKGVGVKINYGDTSRISVHDTGVTLNGVVSVGNGSFKIGNYTISIE